MSPFTPQNEMLPCRSRFAARSARRDMSFAFLRTSAACWASCTRFNVPSHREKFARMAVPSRSRASARSFSRFANNRTRCGSTPANSLIKPSPYQRNVRPVHVVIAEWQHESAAVDDSQPACAAVGRDPKARNALALTVRVAAGTASRLDPRARSWSATHPACSWWAVCCRAHGCRPLFRSPVRRRSKTFFAEDGKVTVGRPDTVAVGDGVTDGALVDTPAILPGPLESLPPQDAGTHTTDVATPPAGARGTRMINRLPVRLADAAKPDSSTPPPCAPPADPVLR
ncbi:hypothetical protein M2266_003650 [Streptomyces sp. SPB162]|nr:hypothetical protein [Streptomyces sp. SPB162]